ncbi:MAG: ABC transporter substrate-binding protein [Chloroflexi bacterium]|nr:ABC transporter substrate-binding protein [Chloroflexota bacterium]
MLGRIPKIRLTWLLIAGTTLALVAAACGSAEPAPLDTAAIQAAVQQAVQQAIPAAPAPVSAAEIQQMVAAATSEGATKQEIEVLIVKATEDAALAAAKAALLAAPQQVVRAAPVAGAAGQKYGGTLKIGIVDFGTMDPALMGLSEGSSLYSELTYDKGTVLWYDGALTPWALESWTSNDDSTQYTFKVRQGIMFHHGKEMKAEDVKFTYDRILDPATASPLEAQLNFISTITAVDDYTLEFDLDGANVFLPGLLSIYHSMILPSDVDIGLITSREFGSGPFTLTEHNPAERTVMDRNPNYWRAGVPYLDQVILFYMPEMTTRIEALKSGAIDVVLDTLTFSVLDDLDANPNVTVQEAPTAGVRVLDFHTDRPPFNNKDLRKAFQYAVDRDFVREATLFGRGSNANEHPVGSNDEYYWDDQPIIKQDIPRAIEYLKAAGYPDGFDVVLTTTDVSQKLDMALAFKESVAAAGIRVEINNTDPTPYWTEFWMNECCPFVASSWGPRPANEGLNVMFGPKATWNESYFENARMDELLALADAEGDFDTRKEYYREVQEILIEEVPVLFLMHNPKLVAHRNNVRGIQVNPNLATYLIQEWWLE